MGSAERSPFVLGLTGSIGVHARWLRTFDST